MEVKTMGKQIIQDLATVLTEKNGLPKADAQRFVTAIFDVIQDGLDRDKLVKLKGLGTFKVVDVEARESVNVNTGERVVIDSHSKISFTPDATMRELVNKPFSGFETVVLNEGVVFEDMDADGRELADEDTATEETVADNAPSIPETESNSQEVESVSQVVENEPQVVENEPQVVESNPQVEESVPQSVESNPQVVESEPQVVENNPQVEDEEVEEPQSCGWGKWLLLTLLACGLSFGGGYWLGQHQTPVAITDTDSLSLASDSLSSASDSLSSVSDSVAALADTLSKEPVAEQKVEPVAEMTDDEKWAISVEEENQKYEAMDSRIRTGAYYIVGTKEVVIVREGDTMSKIARRSIGPELICYIEAYNGLKANQELVVGQKIKIPDLKWKKNIRNLKKKN